MLASPSKFQLLVGFWLSFRFFCCGFGCIALFQSSATNKHTTHHVNISNELNDIENNSQIFPDSANPSIAQAGLSLLRSSDNGSHGPKSSNQQPLTGFYRYTRFRGPYGQISTMRHSGNPVFLNVGRAL